MKKGKRFACLFIQYFLFRYILKNTESFQHAESTA